MIRSIKNQTEEPHLVLDEVDDPAEAARGRAQHERAVKNIEWLESHWPDLLPQARGKFVVVAGQEAFIAESPAEAWKWAETVHPEDNGAFVHYVRTGRGPRIYADFRKMGDTRRWDRASDD